MTMHIDDACYGNLTLMASNKSPDTFYVFGQDHVASFKIGSHILLSSANKIGRVYTSTADEVDVENGTICLGGWGWLKVSDFEYCAIMW